MFKYVEHRPRVTSKMIMVIWDKRVCMRKLVDGGKRERNGEKGLKI